MAANMKYPVHSVAIAKGYSLLELSLVLIIIGIQNENGKIPNLIISPNKI